MRREVNQEGGDSERTCKGNEQGSGDMKIEIEKLVVTVILSLAAGWSAGPAKDCGGYC